MEAPSASRAHSGIDGQARRGALPRQASVSIPCTILNMACAKARLVTARQAWRYPHRDKHGPAVASSVRSGRGNHDDILVETSTISGRRRPRQRGFERRRSNDSRGGYLQSGCGVQGTAAANLHAMQSRRRGLRPLGLRAPSLHGGDLRRSFNEILSVRLQADLIDAKVGAPSPQAPRARRLFMCLRCVTRDTYQSFIV